MTGAATVVIFAVFWLFKWKKAKEEEKLRQELLKWDPERKC